MHLGLPEEGGATQGRPHMREIVGEQAGLYGCISLQRMRCATGKISFQVLALADGRLPVSGDQSDAHFGEGCESIKPIHLRRPAFPKDPHDFLVAGSD